MNIVQIEKKLAFHMKVYDSVDIFFLLNILVEFFSSSENWMLVLSGNEPKQDDVICGAFKEQNEF